MDPLWLLPAAVAGIFLGFRVSHRDKALPPDPPDPPELPWGELRSGHLEAAYIRLAALPEAAWDPEAWECKVAVLRRMGASELAWQASGEGIGRGQASFGLWMERHALAVERAEVPEAERALREASKLLNPDTPSDRAEWLLRRAEFEHLDRGRPMAALAALDELPARFHTLESERLRAQVLLALGRFGEAQAVLEALRGVQDPDLELRLLQADCLAGLGQWEELGDHLRGLPAAAQERADYWHLLGLASAHLGDRLRARDHFEQAAELAPGDATFQLDAAHAWLDLGEFSQAERHGRRALRSAPDAEGAFLVLAECRQGVQDSEGARRLLRECLLRHPDSQEAQEFLAELEAQ